MKARIDREMWASLAFVAGSMLHVSAPAAAEEAEPIANQGSELSESSPQASPAEASVSAQPEDAPAADLAAPVDSIPVAVAPEQPAEAAAEAPQSGNRFIQEIVVTAQKREENLQDVPISIQAFTAETLSAKGVNNTIDLPRVTPGLTYSSLANYSIIFLRGVGSDAFIPSNDASVATYIDGIYFPFAYGLAQTVGGVERIEVLKGPQGTLFGRNSTGGAISVTTKSPTDEWEGSTELAYGRFDETKARLFVSGPITDSLAFSLSGIYEYEDPYYHHVSRKLDSEIARGGRFKLRWSPLDDLNITLAVVELRTSGTGTGPGAQIHPKPPLQALGRGEPPPPYELNFDAESDSKALSTSRTSVDYVDAKWSLPIFDLRLLGSYQNAFGDTLVDFDGTDLPLVGFHQGRSFIQMKTGEFQVLSNKDSWGSEWLTYIGGLYYLRSHAGFDHANLEVGPYDASAIPGAGALLAPILNPLLDFANTQVPTGVAPFSFEFRGTIATETSAAFLQSTANFTDWLALTVGGRVQKERRSVTRAEFGLTGQPALLFDKPSVKSHNFSPKVSLQLKPFDDVMLFGSWSKGFKSGTYNIISIYDGPEEVKPEEVTTYELGVKSDWLDGSLRLNGAVFDTTVKNIQVMILSLTAGGAVSFENAGEGHIKGVEFDATWQMLPHLLPGLVLSANGMYLDAIYSKYAAGSGYDTSTGVFFGPSSLQPAVTPGRDFGGNDIVQTPRWSGDAELSYTFDIPGGPLEVAGDYYFNTGYFFTAQNTPNADQDKFHVINARMSYLYEAWDLRLTAYGTNITSEHYYLYNLENDFGTLGLLHAPATYGMKLEWKF